MYADTKAAVPAKADKNERTGMIIPTIDMINTGRNILRLRKQQGLSVRDLQDIFGFVTPQAIYKWQRGSALPSLDNLVVYQRYSAFPLTTYWHWQNRHRHCLAHNADADCSAKVYFRGHYGHSVREFHLPFMQITAKIIL